MERMERAEHIIAYSETTQEVKITVYPQFLNQESEPPRGVYAFAYTVVIENHSLLPVQLLRRHWIVMSGGAPYTEVRGDGVVGEQPYLRPGDAFQYTSGSVIKDPVGTMYGSYSFTNDRGEVFEVVIPRFDLIYPDLIH